MKIAILGYGSQGRSALDYWSADNNQITICDKNPHLTTPKGVETQLGDNYLKNLDRFDVLVRTPILHPRDILAANPNTPDVINKITTVTNEFLRICPTKNIIGVTGTKGKGTTSSLLAHMLKRSGWRVHLGGNIGLPPLDMLNGSGALDPNVSSIGEDDWVVLELSNFQLIDLVYSPKIAVCLMVESEHLDWQTDFQEYLLAKQQLFRWQKDDDVSIYYSANQNSSFIAQIGDGQKIPYYQAPGAHIHDEAVFMDNQRICNVHEIRLLGEHNWQNVCAATTAAWQVTQDVTAISSAIKNFSGLPFRIEHRQTVKGVSYYNDSFGTTPQTAIVAMDAVVQPKIIILGGSDKGADYSNLAMRVAQGDVRHVILIGQTAADLEKVIEKTNASYTNLGSAISMQEIVNLSHELAQPGDAVILSPACASFDMFKNYQDRGDQFNQAVQSLEKALQ